MKRYIHIPLLVVVLALVASIAVILTLVTSIIPLLNKDDGPDRTGLHFSSEESKMVEYQVEGSKICFGYSFCFENASDRDIYISGFGAKFRAKELKGWIEYQDFYNGFAENDAYEFLIPADSTTHIVLYFEGEYLGGTVNENLSAPIDTIFVQRIAREKTGDGLRNRGQGDGSLVPSAPKGGQPHPGKLQLYR